MNKSLQTIIPGIVYDKGFVINEKVYPFYSFTRPQSDNSWSDSLTSQLEIPSKTHFIDVYNRKIAFDSIRNKLVKAARYLDAGCSCGYMLEDVCKMVPGIEAIGTDYFSAGLAKCHARLSDIPLFQMDLLDCRFPDNLFDAVTCLNVLEHIQDDTGVLKQLFRIMRPAGRLAVTVPMGRSLYDIYDQVHYHVRRYEIGELLDKVRSAGFKVIKYNHFGVFVYPAFYLVKSLNRLKLRSAAEEDKKLIVFNQIKDTSRSFLMEKFSDIEYYLGKYVRYPVGIRAYVVCEK